MSVPLQPNDPAYWMLVRGIAEATGQAPDTGWVAKMEVDREGCYICDDPEFALMGLPLCTACPECSEKAGEAAGHIAADDTVCDDCGHDIYPYGDDNE